VSKVNVLRKKERRNHRKKWGETRYILHNKNIHSKGKSIRVKEDQK
jgi:hypothetical protein